MRDAGACGLLSAAALAALLPALAAAQPPACASATVTGHDSTGAPTLRISPGAAPAKGAAAWASYAATYTAIGWDVINVSTAFEDKPSSRAL